MLSYELRPSRYELGLPEEPQKDGKDETHPHGFFVEGQGTHLLDLLAYKPSRHRFALRTHPDLLGVNGIGPEQPHEPHLEPHQGNVHYQEHDGHVQHHPLVEFDTYGQQNDYFGKFVFFD